MTGYRFPSKTIRCTGEVDTDFAGLWLDVTQVQTFTEYAAIAEAKFWVDIHELIAPHITGWNLEGVQITTETVPAILDESGVEIVPERTHTVRTEGVLPVPALAGGTIFQSVPQPVKDWIRGQVIGSLYHRDVDPKAGSPTSGQSPNGEPDATPDTKPTGNRAARSSSRKRSPAT